MNSSQYNHEMLTDLRIKAGKTVAQVAKELSCEPRQPNKPGKKGVSRTTIYRAESGDIASYSLLTDLARYYGLPVTAFLYSHPMQKAA